MMLPTGSTQGLADLEKVLEPYHYIAGVQGKQIRSQLIHCFNEWLKIDQQRLEIVQDIAESLHSSSLM